MMNDFQKKYTNVNEIQAEQNRSSVYSEDLGLAQLHEEQSPFINYRQILSIPKNQKFNSMKQNSLKDVYNHFNKLIDNFDKESPRNLNQKPV